MCRRIFVILFLLTVKVGAQTPRIDSIKKRLPGLEIHKQVNSLNELGWQYYFYWVHSDSALKYTNLAYRKASQINYNSGRAEALIVQAGVEGRLLGHPEVMEQYSRQAIQLLKKEKDYKTLSMAYYSLSVAYTIEGKYQEGNEAAIKATQIAEEAKDKLGIGWAKQAIAFNYFKHGEYWKSFPYLIESQEIGKELNDSVLTSLSLTIIARSFNWAGDHQKALNYYYEALQFATPFILLWSHHEDMAYAHLQLKQYDSAIYYQQLNNSDIQTMTADPKVSKKFAAFSKGYSIEIQLAKKQYDSILVQVLPVVQQLRQNRDVVPFMQSLFVLGKVYEGKGNYQKSLQYARELYQAAKKINNPRFLKDANELLASIFDEMKQSDSAYYYFKQFIVIQDTLEMKQYAARTALYLAASEAENNIRLLKKDKEIKEKQLYLNKKELEKQSHVKNLLAISLIIFALFSMLILRNIILKRKNEKLKSLEEHSTLTRKALELEMQALRAQMNPHFIFNCLSAIDNLIQTNQADKATSYLARFAKLIRAVLDSSKNNLVPFQKDFETIRLYLEMEKFRCNNKFEYILDADMRLMQGDFKVPPLIVQPFIENAIHHGLLNKSAKERQLKVCARLCEEHITYTITDNGIGRRMSGILKERNRPEHLSYGISISKERIQLHNKNGITNDLVITDLEHEGIATGTEAMVRINCVE